MPPVSKKGWVCLHRDALEHWVYQDSDYWKIWTTMLLKANHGSKSTLFNGSLVTIERGQFVFGREKFSEEVSVPVHKVRKCISLLKKDQMIDQQNKNKYSIISIRNYEQYQNFDQQNDQETDQQKASKTPQVDQQNATSKQLNNENNETNINSYLGKLDFSSWPELPSEQVWTDYKKLRQAKKAPVTQTVIDRFSTQLALAAGDGYTVDDCLSEATEAGWTGFKYEWFLKRRNGYAESNNATNQFQTRSDDNDARLRQILAQ